MFTKNIAGPNNEAVKALTSAIFTKIVNTSLETAHVPAAFKSVYVRRLLKKPNLDKKTL